MIRRRTAHLAGQLRSRGRYLVNRARNLRAGNLVEFAQQSRSVTRKPVPLIIADMLWCSVRYEMGFRDYAVWDVATLRGRERATWMTHPKSNRITATYNDAAQRHRFEDKLVFYSDFADVIGRDWLDARTATDDEVAAFVERHGRVIVKPAGGHGGVGIDVIAYEDLDDPAMLRTTLVDEGRTLVEQLLVQHPTLAAIYPGSVNTVRMITFLDPEDRLHILAAVLRIGNGAAIDNFASGGMYTLLDEEGVARYPGVDKSGGVHPVHPVTGTAIAGTRVPFYPEVLELLEDVARRIPGTPYVGWDIAVTPEGPVLIEGNHNSSVFQTKPTVSGVKTGLLPVYRAAIGF
ncbi:hypothetical protein GCM10022200_04620 [Microbacterium awajiense]|uniref:Alpha-L-glutamate ligase-related protein ATP-grasp domain-containing protein n=1 Tax=Microbacterium awajiense TaxID=415214 RepID=A0ABP7A5Q6_9MICO